MIKHIVMWRLKETAEGANAAENARKMKAMLEGLPSVIGEIRRLEVGINLIDSPDGSDVVLSSDFDSRSDLERYLQHPEHKRVSEFVGKIRSERRFVDYEV
jgi:hypothetical protein